jgi:hypothetical protein
MELSDSKEDFGRNFERVFDKTEQFQLFPDEPSDKKTAKVLG